MLRSEFDRIWKAKSALGTHCHHLLLSWCSGEAVDVDAMSAGYMDAAEKFWIDAQPEWLQLERTIRYDQGGKSHIYRGTLDWIAKLTVDGARHVWIGDWKTGDCWPTSQNLQLCAYRYATALTDWSSGKEEITGSMPRVDHAGVVLLSADGTYRLAELPASRDDHGVFLRLLDAYHYERRMASFARREFGDE